MLIFVLGISLAAVLAITSLRVVYAVKPEPRWWWFFVGYNYLIWVPLLVPAFLGDRYEVGRAVETVGVVVLATAAAGTLLWNQISWMQRQQ